ncbi:MAG TPA: hypothetical protein VE971_05300, partial [Candidatus Eisenbacteria bacterium]|nr:hypothetical protein [Candidatus Eisenbacteria bacterium]
TCACILTFVAVNVLILIVDYTMNSDRILEVAAVPLSNSTDQTVRLNSVISNHSDDIKAIRHSTAAEVQVLKSMTEAFAQQSAQIMYTTLGVFLLGVTLIIYGLRLTLRAPKQTSRYFKAMMCALLSPVIVIVLVYQLGIAFGSPLEIYKILPPLLLITLLLWIPIGIIVFLLVADNKLMRHLEHRE